MQKQFEWDAGGLIAGVDEAGRGPLAGPVFAAAVILDERKPIRGLNDSKLLSPKKRQKLFGEIMEKALWIETEAQLGSRRWQSSTSGGCLYRSCGEG